LLSKVEGLINERKQNIQQLDDLLKSVFLDIFGFNDGTYKQTLVDKLSVHTQVVSGATKGKKYKNEELVEMPYMRVANVQDGYFSLGEIKTILVNQKEVEKYLLKKNDILLTEGGDPDKLGRGAVWQQQVPNCIHQNHIFRVRINDFTKLKPQFLSALIGSSYGKSYFLKSAKQTTGIASINSTQLKNFPTLIPQIQLQEKFSGIVEKVEAIKSHYQQSLSDLETLYGSLSQKAFKGELDLTKVPMEDADTGKLDELLSHQVPDVPPDYQQYVKDVLKNNPNQTMYSAEGRHAILQDLFFQYLTPPNGDSTLEEFWAYALDTASDYSDLENDGSEISESISSFSLADYDQFKDWVFQQIRSNKFSQNFINDKNVVQLRVNT
jgi:type I restriction enzyme S subunit